MADAEFEAKRLAELLRDANRQLADYGEVSAETQRKLTDAQMKAKFGIENYTAVVGKAGEALGAVASAGITAGKAMLEGKKGASALNGSLDDLAKAATIAGTALTLLMPGGVLVKGVVAAFTAVTAATIGSVKAANEMADKLYKGYSGLAKSGGAAADGMTGVFNNANKLGLSLNELDSFVNLINENSTDLAQFSGSVAKGRQRLADMGEALSSNRAGFLAMGLSMQDVNEGMAGYMRIQARTGNLQERSARDSAAAAKEYIYQQDALAKITGISVKEQQKQREAALTEQMFLAKIRQLQREGRHDEAKELENLNVMMNMAGDEMGKGFRASITGRLQDEAARKLMLTTGGEIARVTEGVSNGSFKAAEGFNRLAKSAAEHNERQGEQAALLGINNGVFTDFAQTVRLASYANKDMNQIQAEAVKQQKDQIAGADPITKKQADLMNRQINTNKKMEEALFQLVPAAQDVMFAMQDGADMVADAFKRIVEAINELLDVFGFGKSKEAKAKEKKTDEAQEKYKKSMEGASLAQKMLGSYGRTDEQQKLYEDYRKKESDYLIQQAQDRKARREKRGNTGAEVTMSDIPMAAKGGVLTGPDSGYLAMLHGTEAVVPLGDLGLSAEAMQGKRDTGPAEKISQYIGDISQDLMLQVKTIDKDTKGTKKFSDFQESYQRQMTNYMQEVLNLCENVSPEAVVGTAGAESGTSGGFGGIMGTLMNSMAAVFGATMPGTAGAQPMTGSGLKMPAAAPGAGLSMTAPTAPPGGQGLQIRSQDDLGKMGLRMKKGDVQAEGAKIDPRLIQLAQRIQSEIPEFGVFTGFNDQFHNERHPKSAHTRGKAMDFTLARPPTPEAGAEIVNYLKTLGFGLVKDEYNQPNQYTTGGHFHAQLPEFAEGGITKGPSIAGEKGPEAVIPLKDGTVPVSISGAMSFPTEVIGLFQQMASHSAASNAMLEELVRAQRNSVDVQQKMLRNATS